MDTKQILAHIQEMGVERCQSELSEYESLRRDGRRYRKGNKETAVKAETRTSLTTRMLLGYLWPLPLLKKFKLEHLWAKDNKQAVHHCGKQIVGIIRDTSVPGTIEIFQDNFCFQGYKPCCGNL